MKEANTQLGIREIHHADALIWLAERESLPGCSLITSLPDFSEFSAYTLEQWKEWFVQASRLVLSRCPDDGVTIFYQRDAKRDGIWVDKAFLIQKAAELSGHSLLWHKIVCRAPVGSTTFGRPSYSHLLCFSKGIRDEVCHATPDILPQAGEVTWTRGMGLKACEFACRYVLEHTNTRTIVDPFCGHGTVLAMANQMGLRAIGVEKGKKRAKKARALQIEHGNVMISEV